MICFVSVKMKIMTLHGILCWVPQTAPLPVLRRWHVSCTSNEKSWNPPCPATCRWNDYYTHALTWLPVGLDHQLLLCITKQVCGSILVHFTAISLFLFLNFFFRIWIRWDPSWQRMKMEEFYPFIFGLSLRGKMILYLVSQLTPDSTRGKIFSCKHG